MINEKAITQFLGRKLASYDWMKSSNNGEIDQELLSLNPSLHPGALWVHQKVLLLLALELKRFLFLLDMGGGKTRVILRLLEYRKQRGESPKAIVFVPYLTSVETWVEEVANHAPSLVCVPLLGSTVENKSALHQSGDLYVVCYASAVAMLSSPRLCKSKRSNRATTILPDSVKSAFAAFDTLVLDEVHKCKSVTSLTYQMARTIAAQSEYVFGLTGTPFGRNLEDLWPQVNLIDFGETLGPTLGFYRSVFFKQKQNFWGGYEYTFIKKLLPDLKRMLKNVSISYTVDEMHDLPPKEYINRNLKLPVDALGYARRTIDELNKAVKAGEYRAVESSYLQLRQLASGFMSLRGQDDEKLQVAFASNPKLDQLESIIDAAPAAAKIVVFHHFVYSASLISDRLRSLNIGHVCINGTVSDPVGRLRTFKSDPKTRILVINTKSGSSSLNLQLANYAIFFEQPDSPIDRKQAEARIWRPGQTKRVMIYDLLCKGTADVTLHKSNLAGKNLLDQLMKGKVRL
jgi:SNF2 family DNA or RNA helicase